MKKLLVILSISSLVLMTLNFVLLLYYSNYENIGLLATIISGWVSGLATLAVGIIAALQAKKYNDANNDFVKKQYDLEQSKAIIQSRILFVDNLKKGWQSFSSNCNPLNLSTNVALLCSSTSVDIKKLYTYITDYSLALHKNYSFLHNLILVDYHNAEEKIKADKALESFNNYFSKMFKEIDQIQGYFEKVNDFYKLVNNDFMKEYFEVNRSFNDYILKCDLDINFSIANKIDDINYLKKQYSPNSGEKDEQ